LLQNRLIHSVSQSKTSSAHLIIYTLFLCHHQHFGFTGVPSDQGRLNV
jgi:hypothetical protein